MSALLDTALAAAAAAGAILVEKLPQEREVKIKGPRDVVTDADFAAQQAIAGLVHERFPHHAFLSEEGRHDISLDGPQPVWIVDPLDGTTNYSRRFPVFSVAVAVARNGLVQAGVVHDPLRGETFYAERGAGAFLRRGSAEPQALRVSDCSEMSEALAGVDWAHDPALRGRVLEALARVAGACRTVRAIGSAALSLAYVAAGWLDCYYHLSLQPWDAAAASLLVTEAGGALTQPNGEAWQLGHGQAAASNGKLHPLFINILGL